jgi:hypothetical protein
MARVTFNLDPNPAIANHEGNGWYRCKVNLEFYDTAGVGFTINTVRYTFASSLTGAILLDNTEVIADHLGPRGRTVLQWTSPQYHMEYGSRQAFLAFVADITDDRSNHFTLSNRVNVMTRGEVKAH